MSVYKRAVLLPKTVFQSNAKLLKTLRRVLSVEFISYLFSIYRSLRYARFAKPLPIFTDWKTRWQIDHTATLRVGHQLLVGRMETQIGQNGQPALDRNTICIAANGVLEIAGHAAFGPGVQICVGPQARLTIGDRSYVTCNSKIIAHSTVEIGSGCAISWDVRIIDDHGEGQTIRIGNQVWIGSGVTILPGVTIGDGAVIGAGAVIATDVAPGQTVAGNPARVIREHVNWVP